MAKKAYPILSLQKQSMKGTKGGGVNILLIFSVEASDNRLQPWDSEKSRIPEPETPECKDQVTIPERSHEKLSADAQLLEVTNPEWSGLGDRRVGELHGDPGAPKLYTKEDQVHVPGPEIVSKKKGFHISYATFLGKKKCDSAVGARKFLKLSRIRKGFLSMNLEAVVRIEVEKKKTLTADLSNAHKMNPSKPHLLLHKLLTLLSLLFLF